MDHHHQPRHHQHHHQHQHQHIQSDHVQSDHMATERTPLIHSSATNTRQSPHASQPIRGSDLSPKSVALIITALFMAIFLAALDATIVATILTRIGSDFGRSNEVSWIATSYMLTTTAFQPLYGRLSDVFGRKTSILAALIIFILGSLLCGSAPNLSLLVAARFIAGVGGGGILTCASIIMSDLVSLRERGKYQGMGNAVFGSASMVGAPLGGLLADTVGWRWGFWVNLPVGLAAVMTIIWVMEDYSVDTACSLPNNNYADGTESTSHGSVANSSPSLMESSVPVETVSKSTVYHKLKRIDYGGILTLVLGMTGLVLGLTLGGNELDWDDTTVLGSIISGVLLLCAFVYVESYVAVQPIMPISIIRCQTPAACYWINFFSSMTALSSVFLIPLWFQVVIGYSAAQSGAYLVPKIVASSIGSIASGVYMSRTGRYRGLTWICQIFMIVSPAFISWRWSEITPQWEYVIYIVLDGFGFGSILTTTLVAMLASIPRDDIAVASAMSYLFRAAGAVFGVALSQSSLQAVLKWSLERRLAGKGAEADAVIELARKAAASVRDTVPVEYLGDVVGAYSEAIRFGFLVCFGSAVVSIVGGMWMGQHELPDNLPSAEDVD